MMAQRLFSKVCRVSLIQFPRQFLIVFHCAKRRRRRRQKVKKQNWFPDTQLGLDLSLSLFP